MKHACSGNLLYWEAYRCFPTLLNHWFPSYSFGSFWSLLRTLSLVGGKGPPVVLAHPAPPASPLAPALAPAPLLHLRPPVSLQTSHVVSASHTPHTGQRDSSDLSCKVFCPCREPQDPPGGESPTSWLRLPWWVCPTWHLSRSDCFPSLNQPRISDGTAHAWVWACFWESLSLCMPFLVPTWWNSLLLRMFYHTGFSANVPVSAFFFLYVCPGRQKTPPKNIKGNWNGVNGIPPGESEVAQSCRTLCDPVDYSLPGSSVHGILQARILEWVAISFSRGSSRPRNRTQVSRIGNTWMEYRLVETLKGTALTNKEN